MDRQTDCVPKVCHMPLVKGWGRTRVLWDLEMEGLSKQVVFRSGGRDRTIPSRSPVCGRSTYRGDPLEGMAVRSEKKLNCRKTRTAGL